MYHQKENTKLKLEIDFDKLSEKRRSAVLNALFDGANELEKKYEEVIDKMATQRNENSDCTYLEAQERFNKIYSDNEALIDELGELHRLMDEVYKGEQK